MTETHEVRLWLIKTTNIHVFKMAAPTEDRFPQTIFKIMGWVLRLRPTWTAPPARLVIHRQTFAHAQRDETLGVQPRSGTLALFFTLQRLAADNGRAPHYGARHVEAVAREGGRHAPVHRVFGPEPLDVVVGCDCSCVPRSSNPITINTVPL